MIQMILRNTIAPIFLVIVLSSLPVFVTGAPVNNMPITVENPDGSIIECFVSGDEFFNYLHDENGYSIIAGEDGYHYYAQVKNDSIVASSYKVGQANPQKTNLKPGALLSEKEYQKRKDQMFKGLDGGEEKASHTGILNNIVIYIRFSDDEEFTTPRSIFDNRLNNEDGPSVKDYFDEVSYGMVSVESHHFPPSSMDINLSYQDIYPRSYFQPYHSVNNPDGYTSGERTQREQELLDRAVNAVEEYIPTDLELDTEGNGRVDNVSFIIKGESGSWASILWAHRWMLFYTNTYIHGKRVWDYTFQPENQATVQILNHELFHTFGAPDLYRYSNNSITPVGPWDLMHSGNGHMGAHMKWKYTNNTWIEDIPVISEPGTYDLNPLHEPENNAYRINSPNSDTEYFVVEYRKKQPGTYENNLPGSGLLIYRINSSVTNGNVNGPPDEVYLYRPNGTNNLNGLIFSANYSAQAGRTEINDDSNPSSFLSDGLPGGLDISNISESGSTISFDLNGGPTENYSITAEANPQHGGQVEGAGTYYHGNTVNMTATPADSFEFESWTENGNTLSTSTQYSFTASENRNLVANFSSATNVYHISLNSQPEDAGSVSGGGNHPQGEEITLSASPDEGYQFEYWSENDDVISHEENFSITVDDHREFTAYFAIKTYEITLTANPADGGNVSGSGTFNHGTIRSVNAFEADGYEFENWTENGEVVSTNSQYILVVTENKNLVANFSSVDTETFTISATSSPAEGGSASGTGSFEEGQQANLEAHANTGYTFTNWKENGTTVSSEPNYSFTVTGDRNLTAHFSTNTYAIALDAQPSDGGSVTGGGSYEFGETATVSASAGNGYTFTNWKENGTTVSSEPNYSFTVTGERNLTAHFSTSTYAIALDAQPSDGGSVTGGGSYEFGETATVSALTNEGFIFVSWTEGGTEVTSDPSYSFTVTGNRNLTAHFTSSTHTVTLNSSPAEGGTVSGGGTFAYGHTITLAAEPNEGYQFTAWKEESEVVSTNVNYSFNVTADRNLTAEFTPSIYAVTLDANPAEGGNYTGGGSFIHGETATVKAQENPGYIFVNWSEQGTEVSSEPEFQFQVNQNRFLTANFTQEAYTLNLVAEPEEAGVVSGGGSFYSGETANITATPENGYSFTAWIHNGEEVSQQPEYSFEVNENTTLIALFSPLTYEVNLQAVPNIGGSTNGQGIYTYGQEATISAQPAKDYEFLYWRESGDIISTDINYTFTVTQNRNLQARFNKSSGSIKISAQAHPPGLAFISGAGYYEENQWVELEATPINNNQDFEGWFEGDKLISKDRSIGFVASEDKSIVASFNQESKEFEVEVVSDPQFDIQINGTGAYHEGETVKLELVESEDTQLAGWRNAAGQIVSRSNPYTFTISRNITLEVLLESTVAEHKEEVVRAYPNPSNGYFWVHSEENFHMEIRNTANFVLRQQDIESGNNYVDVSDLPLGMYILHFYGPEKTYSRKVIIK